MSYARTGAPTPTFEESLTVPAPAWTETNLEGPVGIVVGGTQKGKTLGGWPLTWARHPRYRSAHRGNLVTGGELDVVLIIINVVDVVRCAPWSRWTSNQRF